MTASLWLILLPFEISAQANLPVPDHIVVVFLENHAYSQIIGSDAAPYINSLATGTYAALFSQSYALEHPSQPNYLDFYSGCNQGVTDDDFPSENPFTTVNLGRQLIDSGMNFITYSEGLPYEGFNGESSGAYVRKHNPAANWMGTGENQVSPSTNQPFTAFPSSDYTQLPSVCFVVPNQNNNMHDGTDPDRITQADNWIYNNLDSYIGWAKTHNSLLILTFDEDNNNEGNRIPTIFVGEMVKAGEYTDTINHYSVLRTIEDMYGLPYACNAANENPITGCWDLTYIEILKEENKLEFTIYPNPNNGSFNINCKVASVFKLKKIEIYNEFGQKIFEEFFSNKLQNELKISGFSRGFYIVKVMTEHSSSAKRMIIY